MNDQNLPRAGTDAAENAEDRSSSLAAGDFGRIEDLLHEEFLIVDVMRGGVADRASFLAALRDRIVAFDRVQLVEANHPTLRPRRGGPVSRYRVIRA